MPIIDCPNCGAEVSDKALFCGNCGAQIAGNLDKSRRNRKIGIWSAIISAAVIVTFFFIFTDIFKIEEFAHVINYEVLREWSPGQGGIGLDILVAETASKNKVMQLARYLKKQNINKEYIMINIFDLKEAWENLDNGNYSSEKYNKHHLVQVTVDKKNLYDEVNWRALGRE